MRQSHPVAVRGYTTFLTIMSLALTGCATSTPLEIAESRYNATYVETRYDPNPATGWKGFTSDHVADCVFTSYSQGCSYRASQNWYHLQLNINSYDRLIIYFKSVQNGWHFFKKAYANGQELAFKRGARRVGGCSGCVTEYFFVYIPIGMALDSACSPDGQLIAAVGEFQKKFTVKPETIHAFLSKAKVLGARIERPMCDFPPTLRRIADE